MDAPDDLLPERDSRLIAAAVREALARKRMSRQGAADLARISLSTLEKALAGSRPFTLATTLRLEEVLGTALRPAALDAAAPTPTLAAESLGSYARAAVGWIEGRYLTLRPSFGEPGAIYAYTTEIAWHDRHACLVFREAERLDTAFTQSGTVAVPNQSGHVYLVTNWQGQHRLAVLSRPTIAREMFGILTTLQAGRGAQLTPVATPIALLLLEGGLLGDAVFGRVRAGEPTYDRYRQHLARVVDDGFARFAVD